MKHLQALKLGRAVDVPVYDYSLHDRSRDTEALGPCEILIVEGILLLHREAVRRLGDFRVFVDVPESVCLDRRVRRDVKQRGRSRESVLAQYRQTVAPMYRQFVAPSKVHADLILPNMDADAAVKRLLTELRSRL